MWRAAQTVMQPCLQAVLVHDLDRLSCKLVHQLLLSEELEQNLQSSRQNSQSSQQIDRSFLSLGNKPFRLKLSRGS
jgi:DNA invertase Pin-like site-specific DNA recombinase